MIKQFIHTFKNKQKITLSIDLSSHKPKIVSDYLFTKEDYGGEFEKNYLLWVEKFVTPEIFRNLNKKQIEYFEEKGKKK